MLWWVPERDCSPSSDSTFSIELQLNPLVSLPGMQDELVKACGVDLKGVDQSNRRRYIDESAPSLTSTDDGPQVKGKKRPVSSVFG